MNRSIKFIILQLVLAAGFLYTHSVYAKDGNKKEKHHFSKITFSPQVGYAYFPASSFDFDGINLKVDKRNSFIAKAHLDIGGDGLAFEIAPLFAMEQVGGDIYSVGSDLSGGVSGKFFSVGAQTSLVYRASWGRFYPHLGISFHGTYLMGDDIQYGAELYGRIPAGFTVYPAKHFGIVVEIAVLFGATGIRGPDPDASALNQIAQDYNLDIENIDWSTTTPDQLQNDYNITDDDMKTIMNDTIGKSIKFGAGAAFEVMIGFRFP